jgi:hypothetical protein
LPAGKITEHGRVGVDTSNKLSCRGSVVDVPGLDFGEPPITNSFPARVFIYDVYFWLSMAPPSTHPAHSFCGAFQVVNARVRAIHSWYEFDLRGKGQFVLCEIGEMPAYDVQNLLNIGDVARDLAWPRLITFTVVC